MYHGSHCKSRNFQQSQGYCGKVSKVIKRRGARLKGHKLIPFIIATRLFLNLLKQLCHRLYCTTAATVIAEMFIYKIYSRAIVAKFSKLKRRCASPKGLKLGLFIVADLLFVHLLKQFCRGHKCNTAVTVIIQNLQ